MDVRYNFREVDGGKGELGVMANGSEQAVREQAVRFDLVESDGGVCSRKFGVRCHEEVSSVNFEDTS